jgi:hypothetical protein
MPLQSAHSRVCSLLSLLLLLLLLLHHGVGD